MYTIFVTYLKDTSKGIYQLKQFVLLISSHCIHSYQNSMSNRVEFKQFIVEEF